MPWFEISHAYRLLPAQTKKKNPIQNITSTRPVISVIFLSISAYSPEWLAKHNFPEGLSYAWQIRKDMILYIYSWSTNSLSYLHLHSCLLDSKFALAFQMWNNINLHRIWKKKPIINTFLILNSYSRDLHKVNWNKYRDTPLKQNMLWLKRYI